MGRLNLALLLLPALSYAGPDDYRELVKQVVQNMVATNQTMNGYFYTRKVDHKELNGNGSVKSQVLTLAEHCKGDGFGFFVMRQRDGKAVNSSPCDKIHPNIPKNRPQESNDWLKDVHLALDCSKTGEEAVAGKPAIWLSCEPHPGYSAPNTRAKMFEKVRARMLVDSTEAQMIRTDAEIFEPISVAWGVAAKIAQGTRFHLERQKLPDGSWVNSAQDVKFAARVLLKNVAQEEHAVLSDFRRQ